MNKCQLCQKETKNPKFCSKSCSVTFCNKLKPRRYLTKQCASCPTLVRSFKKYCNTCNPCKVVDMKLSEAIYIKHHKSSAFALVRTRARAIGKKLGWKSCCVCGYSKHIEIAHRQDIASYSLDTKVSVINHPNNLIPLCRNCHWEFGKKLIEVPLSGIAPESKA